MAKEDAKVVYVLDAFHIIETVIGHERISNLVEEALKLIEDTTALLSGKMTPIQYKQAWNLK